MGLSNEMRRRLYCDLLRCRYFDEVSLDLFTEGLTPGRMHSYIGEEAIAVGVVAGMEPGDLIVSTHRGGGHLVARGADMRRLFAEYMGRSPGYSGGKGGPMHISVPEIGFLCTNGIVGSGIPVAVGAAMASKRKKAAEVVVCFFGDGAANTGSFHEGINMAAIWQLPVVFVCENNRYAETLPVEKGIAVENISERAAGYGIPGSVVDGNDVEAVHGEVRKSIARARAGDGPGFIEAKTYRIGQHFSGESNHYRTDDEVRVWAERDPIRLFRDRLLQEGLATPDELAAMEAEAHAAVTAAAEQARNDPYPSPDSIGINVYTDPERIGR